ncbi:MAG: hypothetical protein V1775_12470 [Bacteroidota bacterium]
MKTSGNLCLLLPVLVFLSSCRDAPHDHSPVFKHNSPRPECRYCADTNRAAYFDKPVVLADDWSEPVLLAGPLTDLCPNDAVTISRDGKTIYFFWSPTVNGTNEELLHIHTGTYYATRIGEDPGVFSDPRFYDLQKGVQGGSVDGELSFTPDGSYVYFHSTRSNNTGYQNTPPIDDPMDIYMAPVIDGEPGTAINLGEPVNSVYIEGEHTLSPDGQKLFFASTRPGGIGGTDIWVSSNVAGTWSAPVNPGVPVNSAGSDLQPEFPANDPDIMYFTSDRDGPASIYRSVYNGMSWSEPEVVITGYVGEPSVTGDGSIMYFVHVLVDSKGVFGSNIWYVRRIRP